MMNGLFNSKKHHDVVVDVTGVPPQGGEPQSQTFYLHKFPLIAASGFFADYFERLDGDDDGADPDAPPTPTQSFVKLDAFPGGPSAFELLARHCYGERPAISVENVPYLFCGSRALRLVEISRETEAFMVDTVLTDVAASAKVLAASTRIEGQPDGVMVDLVGRCINTVAAQFDSVPELQQLPADCFSCVLRTAKDMGCPKRVLERAAVMFLEHNIDPSPAPSPITPAEFHEVVAAPGVMDDMLHADAVFRQLEILLGELAAADAAELCSKLNDIGLWRCLPHAAIEAAYSNKAVPDRCVTVALMSENRHLLQLNDRLADSVEELSDVLRGHGLAVPTGAEPPKQITQ